MSQANKPNAAVSTERVLSANPQKVFAAFKQPDRLAQWWGPKDFTNTFEQFEFKPGGRWVFVMHGPNGANYPNESVFLEIQPDTRIVIEHVVVTKHTWPGSRSLRAPRLLRRCAPLAEPPMSKFSTGYKRCSRVKVPEAAVGARADP
jgi:hypothetical protein